MILLNPIVYKFQYGQHTVVLDVGTIARQTNSSVMVSMDDTMVLVTVVSSDCQSKLEQDFLPLVVNYQERMYAAGRFPGGFFRREGRPNENEILTSRLIDRPIRPLFPKGFFNDVQITATVMSVNPQIHPDIVATIGVSAALSISDVPFLGPIGVARVGYIQGKYILNPTISELSNSKLDLIISGTESDILMVEAEACLLSEQEMLDAIVFGHEQQKIVINNIKKLVENIGQPKYSWKNTETDVSLQQRLSGLCKFRLDEVCCIINKKERCAKLDCIKKEIVNIVSDNHSVVVDHNAIMTILDGLVTEIVRRRILRHDMRIDGRSQDMIRAIDIKIGVLPRTHGSALFTRGDTQALVTATLGTERDGQNIDELIGERIDRFLLHYNFPPYCTGEVGIIGAPKRREIGHGRLAKRGMLAVMPKSNEFPYTIRVVSEITESNGSSSMASVCGASLALMDAGVPVQASVAGVAMGLVKEGNDFVVLSDIVSDEDHIGDMDFKVSGTYHGITALQMDIKVNGITYEVINVALQKAKHARIKILEIMGQVIHCSRKDISAFAPRIYSIKINPDKIKDVIGKGGAVIRSLTEETDTVIDIADDGTIKIVSSDAIKAKKAICRIQEITMSVTVGTVYSGKVSHIVEFGAFVTIFSGKEGLVHISQISDKRIHKVTDCLKIGQEVLVRVLEVDRQGRIRLSMKGMKNL